MNNGNRWLQPVTWPRPVWISILLIFALAFQGYRGLYSPDEGRYTAAAIQMLEDGDFIHPRLHPEAPHFSKPPLTYWALAASIGTFGRNEWAARLPGTLAFVATVLLIFRLGRRFTPDRPWLPALIYATCAMPYLAATMITTDNLLTLFETLFGLSFVEIVFGDAAQRQRWQWVLGLAGGLSFLTKGPPGLLPLLAFAVYCYLRPESGGQRAAFSWRALLLFFVIGGMWYLKVIIDRPDLLQYFFVDEVFDRIATDARGRNPQWYGGITVYLPTLLIGGLPWLFPAAWNAWKRRGPSTNHWQRLRADAPRLLLWLWLVLPFVVFFFSRSRLPLYVLPLFVPLALLLGRNIPSFTSLRWNSAVLAWCVLLIAVRIGAGMIHSDSNDRDLAQALRTLVHAPINEVIFVRTPPRYGIDFYLDAFVERITLKDDKPGLETEPLAEELEENEGCRLILVEPSDETNLRRELDSLGVAYRVLGWARQYRVFKEAASACASSSTPSIATR